MKQHSGSMHFGGSTTRTTRFPCEVGMARTLVTLARVDKFKVKTCRPQGSGAERLQSSIVKRLKRNYYTSRKDAST